MGNDRYKTYLWIGYSVVVLFVIGYILNLLYFRDTEPLATDDEKTGIAKSDATDKPGKTRNTAKPKQPKHNSPKTPASPNPVNINPKDLARKLVSTSEAERQKGLDLLKHIDDKVMKKLDAMLAKLDDRIDAALVYAELGEKAKDSIPKIKKYLAEAELANDGHLVVWLSYALMKLDSNASHINDIAKYLDSKEVVPKYQALLALGRLGDNAMSYIKKIESLENDEAIEVRRASKWASTYLRLAELRKTGGKSLEGESSDEWIKALVSNMPEQRLAAERILLEAGKEVIGDLARGLGNLEYIEPICSCLI